ncbi:hypothetical protein [Arthrobacter sp. AQ5-05]|uniref:hypothetical protein n=1 Tax=Arthrobacter sp. AQ5-05 TaxID=2184581 RepID=UPI0012B63078|nr:hypothetical protein [Arthrobacter sp. AQ5-05]
MAEQYGSNRDGNSHEHKGGENRGGSGSAGRPPAGDRKPASARPYGDRPARTGGDRPYGNRDDRGAQGGRPTGDRPGFGGNREDRKPFGDRDQRAADRPLVNGRREDRKSFGERDNRGGDRPYGDRKPAGDRDNRGSYGDRPARPASDRPYGDRKPAGDRDNRGSYGDRPARPASDRPYGDRKPAGDRDNRGSYGDRPARPASDRPYGDRKPAGDRDNRGSYGDRPARPASDRPYGDRKPAGDRDNRGSYGDRPARPASDRPYGDRKPAGDRDNRGSYGDRPARPASDRPYGDRKPAGDRDNRGSYGDRPARPASDRPYGDRKPAGNRDDRGPRVAPTRNAGDLRSSNRVDRERSPEIDPDVTGEELDKVTRAQLRILDSRNNEWVSKHLVMAGRLIDFDPELAFQHALAASRRGGRLACVREAVAMTAYAAGNYAEALRELRTYRRISGSNVHLPLMADCERGLGRPDRALDLIKSEDAESLDTAGRVELAIVESGARGDMGDLEAALSVLEIPQLDMNRAFSFSPRLFRAYGMVLRAVNRKDEAKGWERQALVAEEALGIDDSTDSIIVDLGDDDDDLGVELRPRTRVSDVMDPAPAAVAQDEAAPVSAPDEEVGDDADSATFDSDDAESNEDSIDDALDRAEMGGSGDDELDELFESNDKHDGGAHSDLDESADFDELDHRED